nr:hypothetical protein [Tanacetum cinerariifolium]
MGCLLLYGLAINHGLLDLGRRNNNHRKKINTDTCTNLVSYSDRILNDGTPRVDIAKKVVSPSVVEEIVVKEKLSHVVNTTVLGSKQQLPMQDFTSAGNASGKSLYANVTCKPSGTKLNFRTLFTPGEKRVAYHVVSNYVRNTWGKSELVRSIPWFIRNNPLILKKRHLDVKLLKEDVDNVLVWVKLHGVLVTAFSGDGLSVIATKLGTGEMKNLKKTSQTPNGFSVDQKMEFKSTKQVYQPVSKKPTANTSVNKKKNVDSAKEVSIQATNSSGSSFWNVDASSTSTTLVIEKIDKIEKLIIEGEVTLMDDEGKPFEKVASSCDYDSEDEVASVDNDMAKFLAKKWIWNTKFA